MWSHNQRIKKQTKKKTSMICSEKTYNAVRQSGKNKQQISFPELDDGTARDSDKLLSLKVKFTLFKISLDTINISAAQV